MGTDESYDEETSGMEPFGYTGIADLDKHLFRGIGAGGVVLVSGITGSGKTVLAGQIAARYSLAHSNVAFLSTEVDDGELLARTLSCITEWPYNELKDSVSLVDMGAEDQLMPVIPSGNDDFTTRALFPYRLLQKHLQFRELPNFKVDPLTALNRVMEELDGEDVECVILDLLQLDGIVGGKLVDQPKIASMVMEMLAQWAEGLRIPIFVFCQRNHAGDAQDKKEVKAGRVGGIAEFPAIEKLADVTIELTRPNSNPTERLEGESSCYSPNRHLIVSIRGKGKIPWIPVLADFDYQRFAARQDCKPNGHLTDREFRTRVRSGSKRKGCIKFPREYWDRLCDATRHLGARSIYVAMVLSADHKTGRLHWSEDGLGRLFNMGRSVVRRALEKLRELGLVTPVGTVGSSHRREWEVVGYKEKFQDPDVHDYVVLARSMLDEDCADLRIDNDTFSVWLRLLFETRFTPDTDGFVERGQWEVDFPGMAARLGLDTNLVIDVFQRFEDQGRINRWTDEMWGTDIVMLPNFDRYQRMVPWNANAAEEDQRRTNDGPTTDQRRVNEPFSGRTNELFKTSQRRTIDGPTADHRRANDGPTTSHKGNQETWKPGNT